MPANIEIKARCREFEAQSQIASRLTGGPPELLIQRDTFFHASSGRLKLREFADGSAELIQYHRDEHPGALRSDYVIVPVTEPAKLKDALARAMGVRGCVRKRRRLWIVDQTRIHFDEVEGLGDFIELEVVLCDGQTDADGRRMAAGLMERLQIRSTDLVDGAYLDLM